jgi:class 3 adenylate cyclase
VLMPTTVPETQYARAGDDVRIAYQVHGEGPLELVAVFGPASHLEIVWEHPAAARLLERMGSFARVIRFDRRGTGLSDPTSAPPSVDEHAQDLLAVLHAVGAERPALYGEGDAGRMCAHFAAAHPERVAALVLFGTSASGASVITPERREAILEVIEEHWGEGGFLPLFGPSVAADPAFRRWWARFERGAATHVAARTLLEVASRTDVNDALSCIEAPTLVLHRSGDTLVDVALGRELAERIPGARFVELPGIDNVGFLGDSDPLLDEVEEFLTGGRQRREPERVLVTVLFTDIVEATGRATEVGDRRWRDLLDAHDQIVRTQLDRFGGREVKTTGDGFLASFELPSAAVRCARAIRAAVGELGLEVRAGLHTGECELMGEDLGGLAVHTGARVAGLAGSGEVLVSSTVCQACAGAEWEFTDRGRHRLKGLPGEWQLFAA